LQRGRGRHAERWQHGIAITAFQARAVALAREVRGQRIAERRAMVVNQ
jgi:hypothetical protein